jgi:hypothetical protein
MFDWGLGQSLDHLEVDGCIIDASMLEFLSDLGHVEDGLAWR